MKMTLGYFKALLILPVLLHFSCRHEPSAEPTPTCAYDCSIEEMKKYYFFKTGTWWVYEEENTGTLDTVRVSSHFEYPSGSFEFYSHSSLFNFDFHFYHFQFLGSMCYCKVDV